MSRYRKRNPESDIAAPSPSPPLSNAPNRYYRQHHDVASPRVDQRAFQPHWTVRPRLVALVAAGTIGRHELEAAIAWQRWCAAIGRVSGQKWDLTVGCGCVVGAGPTEAQLLSATRLRAACEALGPARTSLLMLLVVDDEPWERLGARFDLSARTVKNRAAEALTALVEWLSGRPVPAETKNRRRIQPGSW